MICQIAYYSSIKTYLTTAVFLLLIYSAGNTWAQKCDNPDKLKDVLWMVAQHLSSYDLVTVVYNWDNWDNWDNSRTKGIVCGPLSHFPDTANDHVPLELKKQLAIGYLNPNKSLAKYDIFIAFSKRDNRLVQRIIMNLPGEYKDKVFTYCDDMGISYNRPISNVGSALRNASVRIIISSLKPSESSLVRYEAALCGRPCH